VSDEHLHRWSQANPVVLPIKHREVQTQENVSQNPDLRVIHTLFKVALAGL
jgi:hypothetical protein